MNLRTWYLILLSGLFVGALTSFAMTILYTLIQIGFDYSEYYYIDFIYGIPVLIISFIIMIIRSKSVTFKHTVARGTGGFAVKPDFDNIPKWLKIPAVFLVLTAFLIGIAYKEESYMFIGFMIFAYYVGILVITSELIRYRKMNM